MNLKTKQKGFTLVELLIVIVVIAILAAISIVAYNGIQNRAVETVIRSDLANFTKKMEIFRVDSQAGIYPTTEADLGTVSISISKSSYNTGGTGNNFLYCPLSSGAGWALVLVDKAGRAWTTTHQSSVQPYTGPGSSATGLSSQTVICPSFSGGQTNSNVWGYTGSNWRTWTN